MADFDVSRISLKIERCSLGIEYLFHLLNLQNSTHSNNIQVYRSFTPIRQLGAKKGAEMEISARINPISYEKPYYKRSKNDFSLLGAKKIKYFFDC